ncbi:MAG: protein kinase [Phycisphaerales bacterium]|nr:protein kinase [Phycisphaerales bacterium]
MTNPVSNLADANLQPGDKLDKYEIVSALGVGGMSRVWKAVDRLLDKPIAIKQLAVDFRNASNQEALRERFRKEAELHKKISGSHKHLVRVIDLLEDPRGLFLLMEYVEGQSLESYLAKHPQPVDPKVALLILGSIAQALAVLHEGGVVHRDLKPANILLPKAGGLKVCDFGLSAFVDEQVTPELGTVRYMAPECFGEAPADPRNDLYSLGMIAYQMLAGEEKFNEAFKTVVRDQRNQALRWMKWHTNARATVEPLHQLVPAIPPALSELVARLMNKELSGRISTANELLAAIRRHFQVPGSESAPATGPATSSTAATAPKPEVSAEPTVALPTRSRKPLYISLVVAAVILVGLGAWGVSSMNSAKEVRLAREAAQQEYSAALAQFKEGNYDQALPMFEKIAKDWSSDQRLSSFSKAHARMAEAETLYAQGEFAQAEAKFQEAEDIGRVVENYAGLDRDHLQKRLREVRTRQSITNIVSEIEGLIREEKFADARERLQRTLRVSAQTLLPEESAKLQELGTRIEGQERQSQIDGVLERARELAAAGQREQALAFLDASLKRFPNRDLQQLSTLFRKEMDMDKAMADLAAAETAGKWPEAAAAARKALQLKRDDAELRQRLSHVLSRAAYERGRKHEQDGDLSSARAAYLEATGLAENKPASDALARDHHCRSAGKSAQGCGGCPGTEQLGGGDSSF